MAGAAKILRKHAVPRLHQLHLDQLLAPLAQLAGKQLQVAVKLDKKRYQHVLESIAVPQLPSNRRSARARGEELEGVKLLQVAEVLDDEGLVVWMPVDEVIALHSQALQLGLVHSAQLFNVAQSVVTD